MLYGILLKPHLPRHVRVEYKWLRFGRLMNFCIAELFDRDETLLVVSGNYCSCPLRKVRR